MQGFPPRVNRALVSAAEERGLPLARSGFTGVLYALEAPDGRVLHRLGPATDEAHFKAPRAHATDKVVCRAQRKLHEALHRQRVALPRNALCADIGSAPGGWTELLSALVPDGHVWSVDPGSLEIGARANVTHLPVLGEDSVGPIAAGLRDSFGGRPLDVVVCDANVHLEKAWALVTGPLAALVREGGLLVLTLKNFSGGIRKFVRNIWGLAVAGAGWTEVDVLHLFANTNVERTLVARRGPSAAGVCQGTPPGGAAGP